MPCKTDRRVLVSSFIVLFLFLASIFFTGFSCCLAAEMDKSLLHADISYFNKMLAQLDANSSQDENVLLQKGFLRKLIQLAASKPAAEIKLTNPSNEKEYLDLFKQYIYWSKSRIEGQKKIQKAQKNLQILKNQIESLAQSDPSLLSLELQYVFYKKGIDFYQANLSVLDKAIRNTPKILAAAISKVKFESAKISQSLQKTDMALKKLDAAIQTREIEMERLSLLEKADKVRQLQREIEDLEKQRHKLLLDKLGLLFLKFSAELSKKDKEVFKTGSQMVEVASHLDHGTIISKDVAELVDTMDSFVLGKIRTFHGQTLQELKILLYKVFRIIHTPIFNINGTSINILKLTMALVVLILGFFLANLYKKNISRISLAGRTLTPATRTLLANLGYYAMVILGFLASLKVVGIDLSSLALVAGALTVGIGFGLQNIVSNLVSGIILMFERSVKIGDYIEFNEHLRGRVVDLRMRSMTINTNANIDVIVPNQDFIQNRVVNWTMNDLIRRFDIPFGVAYGTDPQKVIDAVLKAVNQCDYPELYDSARRKANVVMVGMGDSSLDFTLRVWISGTAIMRPNQTKSKFLLLVHNALKENGIEIPFPQRDLHLRSVDEEIPLLIKKRASVKPKESGAAPFAENNDTISKPA